jgi:5-methylcytosine-specific restriction enzyme subunit McrC
MNDDLASLTMSEWETKSPTNCPDLANPFLDAPHGTRQVVEALNESRMLNISELRNGLEIKAFSYVGRLRVGNLNITILPKLQGTSLLSLLRYAYDFRRLKRFSDATHLAEQWGFEDLLIIQLNREVRELISRGLLRAYITTFERLSSPRGRIDLTRLAMDGGTVTATLPCQHHPRVEDTVLNQVLMAGLRLAGSMASMVELRRESRKLASLMEEQVSNVRLDGSVLDRAARRMNRLTRAYSPALSIIRMLVKAQGVVLVGETVTTPLPGFLFDMNAFFQALLLRFLRENLPGHSVVDEHGLKGMMRYNPDFNPKGRQSPTPRPDYVVTEKGAVRSILDAKYRDLWENELPSHMLYQLVVYAISHRHRRQSSILYPTLDSQAKEARIDVADPFFGKHLGQVCLRPVLLSRVEKLVSDNTSQTRGQREAYAHRLAFGESP